MLKCIAVLRVVAMYFPLVYTLYISCDHSLGVYSIMDHVIRTCVIILQDRHSSPILIQVIIVVMAIYYHGILL